MKRFADTLVKRYMLVLITVALFGLFAVALPNFASVNNMNVMMVGRISVGFFALAALVPQAVGEFDISLGYMLGACIMVGAKVGQLFPVQPWVILLCVVLCGAALGAFNGFLAVTLNIPSTISTLGSGMMFYAISLGVNNSKSINSALPKAIVNIFRSKLLGINIMVYLLVAVGILLYLLLEKTPFGKRLYAVGASQRVSQLAGVRVNSVRFASYVIAGLIIGIGAALNLGQSGNAYPDTGPTYLMPGLATVFLSITMHKMGKYNVPGTLVSIVMLGILFNGLSMFGMPFWFESVANGLILLAVVLMNGKEFRSAQVG